MNWLNLSPLAVNWQVDVEDVEGKLSALLKDGKAYVQPAAFCAALEIATNSR